jgi:hypothetical protein
VNISHMPCSSALTLTYRLPQPIFIFSVTPMVTCGRGRGWIPLTGIVFWLTAAPPFLLLSVPLERTCSSRLPSR